MLVIRVWHPALTGWQFVWKATKSHLHTPLVFPRAPQIRPPVTECSLFLLLSLSLSLPLKPRLHATLHRRYQSNWQWLEICSIIEPRPVWLTGLEPPPFETDPSSGAISDIQFVLKLLLRGPQGSDLINIFYGKALDVAESASGPVLIIVRAHYCWLCDDGDSEAWHRFMNVRDWFKQGRESWFWWVSQHLSQLEANQKWFM